MGKKSVKLLVVTGILLLGLTVGFFAGRSPSDRSNLANMPSAFTLSMPAFAAGVPADQFPMNEAGISAYVNLGQKINLARARSAFKGIEADETDYIIGIIELPNLAEDMWPHAYVSKSGWIMTYYPKTEPTSRIMQWAGYRRDVITTTTLKDALVIICQKMALDPSKVDTEMHYYHFQYPDATKLLIAVDTTPADSSSREDTFTYIIPGRLNLYEGSWSDYGEGNWDSVTKIDGTIVSETHYKSHDNTHLVCDILDTQNTVPGSSHTVQIWRDDGWVGCAVVFLYR